VISDLYSSRSWGQSFGLRIISSHSSLTDTKIRFVELIGGKRILEFGKTNKMTSDFPKILGEAHSAAPPICQSFRPFVDIVLPQQQAKQEGNFRQPSPVLVTHLPPPTTHHPPPTTHHPPSIIHHPSSIIHNHL